MNFNILNKGRSLLSDDQNKKFNFFIIMFLIAMVLETAGIGMVIPILNLFSQNNFHEKVDEFLKFVDLEKYSNEDLIIFSIIILLVLYTIKALFLTFVSYQESKFLSEIKSSTSERIFKIYLKKPFTFHLENNSAKLIRNLNDINLFTVFIRTTLLLFIEVIMFFGVGLLIFFYEPLGTIFSMTILGLLGFFFHRKIQKKAGQRAKLPILAILPILFFIFIISNCLIKMFKFPWFISSARIFWLRIIPIVRDVLFFFWHLFAGSNINSVKLNSP